MWEKKERKERKKNVIKRYKRVGGEVESKIKD